MSQNELITAIVQARMTSTRLPGKVLMKVAGRPLLDYQVKRIQLCRRVGDIILATTDNATDDPVADLGHRLNIGVFRGSEHDVLDRFYNAASEAGAKHVLRITGDCPLVDPRVCDRVAEAYMEPGVDIAHTGPTFAEGVDCEVFSFEALQAAWKEARLASEREHCTTFIYSRPERFKVVHVDSNKDESGYRFTVDEPCDLEVVRAIIQSLPPQDSGFPFYEDVLRFLDANSDIKALNNKVIRNEGLLKSLREDQEEC